MSDLLDILTKAGPWVAALLMSVMIKWLLSDRKRLLSDNKELVKKLEGGNDREKVLLERRTTDLLESQKAVGAATLMVSESLKAHDNRLDNLISKIEAQDRK